MRRDLEIVYVDGRGAIQVLGRAVPKGLRDRWGMTKRLAALVLREPLVEDMDQPGYRCAFRSAAHPDDGFVAIRERE